MKYLPSLHTIRVPKIVSVVLHFFIAIVTIVDSAFLKVVQPLTRRVLKTRLGRILQKGWRKIPGDDRLKRVIGVILLFPILIQSLSNFFITPLPPGVDRWHMEKVQDGAYILKDRDPIKQTITSMNEDVDLNLKENPEAKKMQEGRSQNQGSDEVYRWSVTLPTGTTFSFGKQTEGDGILPIVKVMTRDGWLVRYIPKVQEYVVPVVEGNVISWKLTDGITARYTMQPDRVKADYIVNSVSDLSCQNSIKRCSLDFTIETNTGALDRVTQSHETIAQQIQEGRGDVSLELLPGGDIAVINDLQKEVLTIPAPVTYDADKKAVQSGEYQLQNDDLQITFSLDDLKTARFPLTIDPVTVDNGGVGVQGTGYGMERNLLRDGWGNLVVLCNCGSGTNSSVWYKPYNSNTWTTANIDLAGTDHPYQVGGDFDSAHNIHITYGDNGDGDLYYRKMVVTRNASNAITAIDGGSDYKLDTIDGSGGAAFMAMSIANKGGGDGVEKVAVVYNSSDTFGRSTARFMQCDVSDGCTTAANWKNASEEKNGSGTCSDVATSGNSGLPDAATCKGVTDELFTTASEVAAVAAAVQLPGRPKRSPTKVYKYDGATYTDLTDTYDQSTSTSYTYSFDASDDYLYVGDDAIFSKVVVDKNSSNVSTATMSTREYYNGSTWTAVSNFTDRTFTGNGTFSSDGSMLFDQPSDWAKTSINGESKYWIRFRPSLTSSGSIYEFYITDRNARAMLIVGGENSSNDLRAAFIPWDEINNDRWEARASVPGNGWQVDAGGASSALSTTGYNATTYTNHPLSMTVDTLNNTAYVTYIFDTGTDEMEVKGLVPQKDPTVAANWTDTAFPAVTEAGDITPYITSDGADIYMFYNLNPGTNSLVWRKCTPSAAGSVTLCDNTSDWGSESTLVSTTTAQFPKALVSKAFGDTIAFDVVYADSSITDLMYERHFVNLSDKTVVVSASGDDATHRDCTSGTDDQDSIDVEVYTGAGSGDASCVGSVATRYHSGFRFQNVTVSPGVKVASAYIDFRVNQRTNNSTTLNFDVYGEDNNSSQAYTSISNCTPSSTCLSGGAGTEVVGERTRTTSKTTVAAAFDTQTYRIDVTKQVQEIICRGAGDAQPCVGDYNGSGSWASGNNLGILFISTQDTASSFFITAIAQDNSGATLDPTLQINLGEPNKEYSMGAATALPTGSGSYLNLDHALASLSGELNAVRVDDYNFASISATTTASYSAVPAFMFKERTTSPNDYSLNATVVAKSNAPPDNRTLYLQVYRAGSTNDWVTVDSDDTSAADTDVTLSAEVTADVSEYYHLQSGTTDQYWSYWRVYQQAPGAYQNETLSLDYFGLTYSEPYDADTASGAPAAYWKFDEGGGTTAKDSILRREGTLAGATTPVWKTSGECVVNNCLYFNGSTASVTVARRVNPTRSVSFWVRPNSVTSSALIDLDGTARVTVSSGTISATGFTGAIIYVNGVATSTLTTNSWQHVTVTSTADISANAIKIGNYSSTYYQGFMDEVKLFQDELSAAQVKSQFNARGSGQGGATLGAKDDGGLSNGLVGYWKMDETAANSCGGSNDNCDSSGNGFDGAWNGNATASTSAKFGAGTVFDGTNDYVSVSHNAILEPTEELTYSAWIKWDSLAGGDVILSKNDENAGSFRTKELIILNTTSIRFGVYNGSNLTYSATVPTMVANTWYHLAVAVKDNQFVRLYFNGTEVSAQSITADILLTDNQPFTIGGLLNTGTLVQDFDGVIDEVRVYNRALSSQEVQRLYNWAPGPLSYWDFENGSSTTVYDKGSLSDNGTWGGPSTNRYSNGKYGKAGSFSSTTDYLDIGSASDIANYQGNVTMMGWVNLSSTTETDHYLLHRTSKFDLRVRQASGAVVCTIVTSGGSSVFIASNAVVPRNNTWHHVACTYDGENMRVYVDGVLLHSQVKDGLLSAGATNFYVGAAESGGPGGAIQGKLDDVKIYSYARSAKQITEDMNASHPAGGSPVGSAIGHWKFDAGSGNVASNSGTLGSLAHGRMMNFSSPASNNSGWTQNGKFNKALNFDGTDDVVEAGSDAAVDNMASFSVSAWVNPRSMGELNLGRIIQKAYSTGAPQEGWLLAFSGTNGLQFYVDYTGTDLQKVTANNVIVLNAWQHVLVTWDGSNFHSNVHIYINGKEVGYSSYVDGAGSRVSDASSNLNIGNTLVRDRSFDGWIDEVKLYNDVLSPSEVKIDYTRGSSTKFGVLGTDIDGKTASDSASRMYCPPGDTTAACAPIGEWRMEERQGSGVGDSSGYGNSGSLVASPQWTRGKVGSALQFTNGSNQNVTIAAASPLNDVSTKTISMWINPATAGESNIGRPLSKEQWYVGMSGNRLVYRQSFSTSEGVWLSPSNSIPFNTWTHVVIIHNNSSDTNDPTIYLNGRSVTATESTPPSGTATSDAANPLFIGNSNTGRDFDGTIDEVKIYNYALSQSQAAWDYNRGKPLLHWKFDECQGSTANDSSGNLLYGTLSAGGSGTNASVGDCSTADTMWGDGVSGKFNYSLEFDGTNDYVSIADTSTLDLTSAVTLSAWIKPTSVATTRQGIISKRTSSGTGAYMLGLRDSRIEGDFPTTGVISTDVGTISAGVWTHVAITYDGTNARFYKNGVLIQTTAETGSFSNSTHDLHVGHEYVGTDYYFTGQIDDPQVFNYALTNQQIQLLHNQSGAVRFGPATGAP